MPDKPSDKPRIGVLFVCLGNICRSPLAKAVFTHRARARGVLDRFDIDSCGTGAWHVGGPADPRTVAVALANGIRFDHVARQLDAGRDFTKFRWLIAMDAANARNLIAAGAPPERVRLLRSFDPACGNLIGDGPNVPDPYHGGERGFEEGFRMVDAACEGLLRALLDEGLNP